MTENQSILKINNVRKHFGTFEALKNINIEVKSGRITGFLGKNGAGKTTLIKTILGLYKDFDGEIFYDGQVINPEDAKMMCTIGSLVDIKFHEDLTAYDNLKLLLMASHINSKKSHKQQIYEVLKLVDLEGNAKDKVKSFSMGMKQRLGLAQALMMEAKLLILDEPFVGLDPVGIQLIKERLLSLCHEQGVSIIFSSHQLTEVSDLSDDIIVINKGEITYTGTYESLVNEAKSYHLYLDKSVPSNLISRYQVEVRNDECEIIFKKSDVSLPDILVDLMASQIRVEDISIQENTLLHLFQNEEA